MGSLEHHTNVQQSRPKLTASCPHSRCCFESTLYWKIQEYLVGQWITSLYIKIPLSERVIHIRGPFKPDRDSLFRQDNAQTNTGHTTATRLGGISTFSVHVSAPLTEFLGGQYFSTDDEGKLAVVRGWHRHTVKSLYTEAFEALVTHCDSV